MIFYREQDETDVVQAMRVPTLFDIDGRVRFDMWVTSIGAKMKWSGGGIKIGETLIASGWWITWNFDMQSRNLTGVMTNAEFVKTYRAA